MSSRNSASWSPGVSHFGKGTGNCPNRNPSSGRESRPDSVANCLPEKNSENFRILQSHNKLSARHLQKQLNVVLTKTLKLGKHPPSRQPWRTGRAELSLKNLTTDSEEN